MIEHFYICPYCAVEVSLLVDAGARNQVFIEDCERCCNPVEFRVTLEGNEVVEFDYTAIEQ